jgi:hypothetical protein
MPTVGEVIVERLLVDSCVWLDIAVDARLAPLLDALDSLSLRGRILLVVPDVVVTEIDRNANSVEEKTRRVYEGLIREALDMAHLLSTATEQEELRHSLGSLASALPTFQGALNSRMRRVRAMLGRGGVLSQASTDAMMVKAFRRGLAKKAPFRRGKNSCGDALILEHFDSCSQAMGAGDRCVFISSNKLDFGSPEDHRLPHPDLADLFDGVRTMFSINLAEYIRGLDVTGISTTVVEAAREAAERASLACPAGGEHDFDPKRGANLRSRHGGFTWHLFCRKCGAKVDTGDWSE